MSSVLDDLNAEELMFLANAFAIALANGLTADEINILAAVVSTIGDLLAIIAAKQENIESNNTSNCDPQ